MRWSKESPKVSGWYFHRTKTYGADVDYFVVYKDGSIARDYGDGVINIQQPRKFYEWAGPIPSPEEPS